MPAKPQIVKEYLRELQKSKGEKPQQIKDALEVYLDLWGRVLERGVVSETDTIDQALAKIDENGGLYAAAEGQA